MQICVLALYCSFLVIVAPVIHWLIQINRVILDIFPELELFK